MSLETGTRLGVYEIVEPIGKGGMGEVYRARDTKLGRDVAIKVLPEELSKNKERLDRFEREARLLAQLNHTNVATLYGFEDGYIIMELIEGETLAERIARGPIAVDEAVALCLQMAEGLEAAHEKGIIHRDLKPANAKITEDGKIIILDFGLAKALSTDNDIPDASSSASPTLTRGTALGTILGTAAYMSPEQAKGKRLDKRTDIWAFGCVLYEMLTGRRAFPGDDVAEILAAVLRAEPDWSKLPSGLNPRVREVIERCLEKEARHRSHDIADVRIDLESFRRDPHGSRAESLGRPSRSPLVWIAASFVLGAAVAATSFWRLRPAAEDTSRPVQFSFALRDSSSQRPLVGPRGNLAMSPDGMQIAYIGARSDDREPTSGASRRQLYLRHIDEPEARPIAGTDGGHSPFFSPDGEWVGFAANGKLRRAPVAGGAPLEICSAGAVSGASWGADDSIIYGGGLSAGLLRVNVSGGQPESLTKPDPDKGEIHHGFPEILPDGRTVLFTIGTGEGSRLAKLSLDTGETEDLLPFGSAPRYLSAGYVVFSDTGNLRLVRFDVEAGDVVGSVIPAADGVRWESFAGLEDSSFAVSPRGDLAFIPGGLESLETNLVWVDRRGEETNIDADRSFYLGPRISPDGRRIAVNRLGRLGFGEVWVMNIDGSQAFPLADEGADYNVVWTPDGTTITYTSNGDLFEKRVDREDARVPLLSRPGYLLPRSWDSDGELLVFRELSPGGSRVWVMPRDGEPEPLLDASFNSGAPRFAPHGDWIVYVSDESGQNEVYIRRFPGAERGKRVSVRGGREPVWSADGTELYYRDGNRMMAIAITTEPELRLGNPVELWEAPHFSQEFGAWNYDVAADGRFLMLKVPDTSNDETTRIHVFLNWLADVEKRMQAND